MNSAMIIKWQFKVLFAILLGLPAIVLRLSGIEPPAPIGMAVFGFAIVASAFLLAWGAETAEKDISASLAVAILALIAVLPEYAVDLYFAYAAGHRPEYAPYAVANMTGSNRLLIGIGWSMVALISGYVLARGRTVSLKSFLFESGATLFSRRRIELLFLGIAGVYAFLIPLTRRISLLDSVVLLSLFGLYIWRVSGCEQEEPELVGVAEHLGTLPRKTRRLTVSGLFLYAAIVVLSSAEPFANALVHTGKAWGIDEFLLVQWLAPLASESPEFVVAFLLAFRKKTDSAIGTLLSSKVNQWTLLIGSIPLAYLAGGGSWSMHLDARQVEEVFLTASQTLLGLAFLINLKLTVFEGLALFLLFIAQFFFPQTEARLWLSVLYLIIAGAIFFVQRKRVIADFSGFWSKKCP
ncbi:MAG TPA: sodium:proton exchanger [Bdellovibrionota bacterium]|nr:sodium:proton exchanger [Bdellovibrionota bacterium]